MRRDDDMGQFLNQFFGLPGREWPERALLQVDPRFQTVTVIQPEPCDCIMTTGGTVFPAEAADCHDATAADGEVFRFDYLAQDPARLDGLSPADLNNAACYLLWQSDASPESAKVAYDLLKRARQKTADDDPLRSDIDRNLDRFRPVEPGVPRPLAMLQSAFRSVKGVMGELDDWIVEKVGAEDDG